jgi:DNA adenine methylase
MVQSFVKLSLMADEMKPGLLRVAMDDASATAGDGTGPTPCLRWAGGKRRQLAYLEPLVPTEYNRYFEPMVGAAALFLRLQPSQAILGDSNAELIGFYEVLRDNTEELIARLRRFKASEKGYYEVRAMEPICPIDRAARFAFLNRLAWNGVYRVNKEGKFNVPFGKRIPSEMWDYPNLRAMARALKTASLFRGDFEECTAAAESGDFVFIDPPYPRGANDGMGFNRYTTRFFSYEDHERLARSASDLVSRGVLVMIAESAHPDISTLYSERFNRLTIEGKALIAGKAEARRTVRELLLYSYEVGS